MLFRVLPSSIDQTVKTPKFLIAKIIQNGYLDGVCYTGKLFDNLIVTNSYKNWTDENDSRERFFV